MAVAAVTVNRWKSKNYPDSLCTVVKQRSSKGCQFSWVCDRRIKRPTYAKMADQLKIANAYLNGKYTDPTKGSLFYHARYVSPQWSYNKKPTVAIGTHLFYRKV